MNEQEIASARAIELGRALLDMGYGEDAAKAFSLALRDTSSTPEETMEAALGLLQGGGDYHAAYDALLGLYNSGAEVSDSIRESVPGTIRAEVSDSIRTEVSDSVQKNVPDTIRADALSALTEAFYLPNENDLRQRYRKNRGLLKKYPYLFRQDFPEFEDLPLRFYPYDDGVYYPFDGSRFLPRARPGYEVISRNFFRDLEQPVLASDVYSQYELAYLRDNVRRSEDVGRENHVYLHYTDWSVFCAWMQVLDFRPLLREEKLVFLMGDELRRYPIDFLAEYGIDYGQFPVKPVGVREVTRLIWHTQLSSHNGGDFFNEIFDSHPNLICLPSIMLSEVQDVVDKARFLLRKAGSPQAARQSFRHWENPGLAEELYRMKRPTDKDILVALYLGQKEWNQFRDRNSRIAPALFFQPHFPNIIYTLQLGEGNDAVLSSKRANEVRASPLFQGFPYIKTFLPMRRFTASFGAAMRFMMTMGMEETKGREVSEPLPDVIVYRVLNRSFQEDPTDRLFRDSVVVRFEDGKLNPAATFSRLAAFADLPYTQSMTFCSERGARDPRPASDPNYAAGFSLASLHRDDSRYMNENEMAFIEYSFRDAYARYGYDFQHYTSAPMDAEKMRALIDGFTRQDQVLREDWDELAAHTFRVSVEKETYVLTPETPREERERLFAAHLEELHRIRQSIGTAMLMNLRFVTEDGLPLRTIPMLEPDPDLLENPLYH